MQQAMALARRGLGRTSPNPMVGCVIVRGTRVVAEGWHARCGGPHAEIAALQKAGALAHGARMYVTLEPCAHFGKTPPCVDDIIAHGLSEVYIGTRDPNPLTCGKSVRALRRAGIKVSVGILTRELTQLNAAFFKFITRGLPLTTAKIAQTLDGKIATRAGRSEWISSIKSRKFARKRRTDFDGILTGINTVLRDDPLLDPGYPKERWFKIIVDSSLKIPLKARVFGSNSPCTVILAVTAKADQKKIQRVQKFAEVWMCPSKKGRVDLRWLWRSLARRGITNLLLEGGGTISSAALREKLVDKMHLYLALKIFGDERSLSAVQGFAPAQIADALELKDAQVTVLGQDIFVEGNVRY